VRTMSIPPFERKIEIGDFDFFVRSRLAQAVVIWRRQPRQIQATQDYFRFELEIPKSHSESAHSRVNGRGSQL
jgi:hypothetical protein